MESLVWGTQPIFGAIDSIAAQREADNLGVTRISTGTGFIVMPDLPL
jgi:hypothetical protein